MSDTTAPATAGQATPLAVVQLSTVAPQDVASGLQKFDAWLRSVSDGYVTLDRVEQLANYIPVVSNIIAAVDVILDIKDLIEAPRTDFFDFLNLGIDLIGIIPLPPVMGEFRMGARPILALAREELERSAKAVVEGGAQMISDAVITLMVNHLSTLFAGEIEKFVQEVQAKLGELLNDCANHAKQLLEGLATVFERAASGTLFDATGNLHAADVHMQQMSAGFAAHDAGKIADNLWSYLKDGTKVLVKDAGNLATTAANVISPSTNERLRQMAAQTRHAVPMVVEKIKGLNSADVGGLMWLLNALVTAVGKWRAKQKVERTPAIKENGTTHAEAHRGSGQLEKSGNQAEAKAPGPNDCKSCGVGASNHSIGFALGDERFDHDDFMLPGAMPIVWTRTYRSSLSAYDEAEFGARWISAYTTRVDIHAAKLVYHDASGRSIDYPKLAAGETHDDRGEDLTLTQLDATWLSLTRGHELIEVYEKRGDAFRLAFLRDRNGNQVVLDYDDRDWLRRVANDQGSVALSHDKKGRIVGAKQIDQDGEVVATLAAWRYDEAGDLIDATDRHGNRREYRYQHHLVTRYTDRTGRGMNFEWNGSSPDAKCVHEYADDGSSVSRLEWHRSLRIVDVTDGLGQTTRHYYDIDGYTGRIIHPDGLSEWFDRDAHHNLTQHILPDGSIERFRYDARGNLVERIERDGGVVRMEYDAKDQLVAIVDPHGYRWTREYDSAGNVTKQTDPLGHETRYSYNAQGLVTEIVDAKGGAKALSYTDAGQLASYVDCSGKTTKWRYDGQGRIVEMQDASGNSTTWRYDESGQLAAVITPAGIEKLEYDAEGRLLVHTDGLNQSTRYVYDAAGRIAQRRDALGETLQYRYDPLGRISELVDANQASYRFRYDLGGRLLEETGFDGITTRYGYDPANGRLQTVHEADCRTELEFDASGRITRRASGESEERFAYDSGGRLVDAQNTLSRVQRFFDPVGNVAREHHAYLVFGAARSYVWHHEYDEIGTRVKTVRPDGHAVDWLIYGSGHVHGVLLDGRELFQFERDNLHRETERRLANRIGQNTRYDAAGRIERQSMKRAEAVAAFAVRDYRYDAAGRLAQIEDSHKGSTRYQYDPVGRLIEAVSLDARERFAFDPASNIVDRGDPEVARTGGSVGSYAQNSLPPQTSRVLGNLLKSYAGTHYRYDARGNLVERQSPGELQRYRWSEFNRMTAASVSGADGAREARYFYDAFGRRIAKQVDGVQTVFGWDGDQLAFESVGERSTHYLYEARTFVPLAQFVSGPVDGIETPVWNERKRYQPEDDALLRVSGPATPAQVFYYHCDQIGTPQFLTDELGEVVWEASFKAWGETREVIARVSKATQAVAGNSLRFQGQQVDAETGLHYNRYRYYDPKAGRFVSRDPIGLAGGVNVYAYAPNPVQWVDPFGLAKKPPSSFASPDGDGATDEDMAASRIGGGSRAGQSACRERLLAANKTGVYKCWRCGQTSTNPNDMHLGHRNVATANGGNLSDTNIALEGASCNLSAGSSGYVKEGMSCVERGSCGAPYGR